MFNCSPGKYQNVNGHSFKWQFCSLEFILMKDCNKHIIPRYMRGMDCAI